MLGRKTYLSLLSLLFTRLVQGIILLVAVNRFFKINFGFFSVAQSLLAFLLFFSDLNLSTAHLKLMAEEKDKNVAFSTYFYLKIVLLIVSSVAFIFIIMFSLNFNLVSNNPEQVLIIVVVFLDRLLVSFLMVYNYSFQATFQIAKKEIATIIGQIIGFIFGLISILVLHNFILYILNTTISNLFSLSLCVYFGRGFKLTKIRKDLMMTYLKLNMIFILPFFLNVITTNLGPLIFIHFYNEDLLGIFNIIASFFLMIQGIIQVFRSLLIPNFSILIQNNKLNEIQTSINLFEKYTAILTGVIITLGIIFGDYVLKVLNIQTNFESGLLLYFGYLISLISFSLTGPYTPLIIASVKFKVYTISLIIPFIFAIISWFFFIPPFNILGINLGVWISIIPQSIFIRYYCFKYFKTGNMHLKYGLNLSVIFVMICVSFFIFSLQLFIVIRAIIILGILLSYLGFLIFTKLLTKSDYKYLKSVVNPKEMLNYIRNETFD